MKFGVWNILQKISGYKIETSGLESEPYQAFSNTITNLWIPYELQRRVRDNDHRKLRFRCVVNTRALRTHSVQAEVVLMKYLMFHGEKFLFHWKTKRILK